MDKVYKGRWYLKKSATRSPSMDNLDQCSGNGKDKFNFEDGRRLLSQPTGSLASIIATFQSGLSEAMSLYFSRQFPH